MRAAAVPQFAGRVAGDVEVEGGEVSESVRRWRYLIFPAAAGPLEIPPVTLRVFVPSTQERRELRCEGRILQAAVRSGNMPSHARDDGETAPPARRASWYWLLLLVPLVPIPFVRRELQLRREVRELMSDRANLRARIDAKFGIDIREATDRGDAYRALRSLLDAAEHERDVAANSDAEVTRRLRELLRIAR